MPRIAKADVNNALKLVAQTIITAGGADGRTSRAEMTAALKTMPKDQRALADIFFKFVDHRDFKKGAQVTKTDVTRAVEYAKTTMIAKYDLNNDGLSKTEIKNMSITGQRAVDLAKALKAAGTTDVGGGAGKLNAADLGKAINAFSDKAIYYSEGDSNATSIAANFPASKALTGDEVFKAFKGDIKKALGFSKDSEVAFEFGDEAEAKAGLKNLGSSDPGDDDSYKEASAAFKEIGKLMSANVTDLRTLRVGPRGEDGKLASDRGSYAELTIGRTADGKLAGFIYTSVET
jgi:hypothetical protein